MEKVIVVGAGIGGLATAIQLLGKGYEVTVYERNKKIGGRVNQLKIEGFTFDTTASILMMPRMFEEVFESVGRRLSDYLEWEPLDPYYRYFSKGEIYDFSTDVKKIVKTLERFSQNDVAGYFRFLGDTYEKYQKANENFLNETFLHKGMSVSQLVKGVSIFPFTTSYSYLSSYIRSDELRQFLAFQAMYVGISPFDGPNVYTFLPLVTELFGLFYIKGGMYRYIEAMEKLILELGGEICCETIVEKIEVKDERVKGVYINGELVTSDVVVCNCDFPQAMKTLIHQRTAREGYKVEEFDYSCSVFILYLGLKKRYDGLAVHNVMIGEEFKKNVRAPFQDKIPLIPPMYVYCPTRIDETMAPENCESLHVTIRVPNLLGDHKVWDEELCYQMKEIIYSQLESSGLEGIREEVIVEEFLTPVHMKEQYDSYGGTAFGISPTLTQTNHLRPQVKSEKTEGLYYVGSSIHPGTGMSMVLKGSQLVVDTIIQKKAW